MSSGGNPFLKQRLHQHELQGLRRELKRGMAGLIDFASNDYLGLARSGDIINAVEQEIAHLTTKNGSTGSRLLTGNNEYVESVEIFLANIFQGESALIFNSGYVANLALLSSIPQKADTIIYDELCHASIKDGARLSLAKRLSFRHNDLDDLKRKVLKSTGNIFVIVESVYSMDGDFCPLEELTSLAEQLGFAIILDEAHSTGIMGFNGGGYAVNLGIHQKIFARLYTFGKAMGAHGACVVGSADLRSYLINFARPLYTPQRCHLTAQPQLSARFNFSAGI